MTNKPIEQWTRQECEEYLNKWPQSLYAETVRKRYAAFKQEIEADKKKMDDAEDDAYWIEHQRSKDDILKYMQKFKNGRHIHECDDAYWLFARLSSYGILDYMKYFPQGKHISQCDDEYWNKERLSSEGLKKYKEKFPTGKHISNIDDLISSLKNKEIDNNERELKKKAAVDDLKELGRWILIIVGVGFVGYALYSGEYAWSVIAPVAYYTSRLMK